MNLISGFEMYLRAAGRRPIPVDRTVRNVRHYLAYCNGFDPLERRSLLAYLSASAGTVKLITLRNRWDALRSLTRYALAERLVDDDPMARLPRPKVSGEQMVRDAPPITENMLRAVLAICPSWNELGSRDQALMLTLWDTPLRASELCGLEVADVDWEKMELRVTNGKAGVRYETPFTDETGLALARYLRRRGQDSPWLFATQQGAPLTPGSLAQLLRRLSARAGFRPPLFAHQFRHNFRARMHALGLDDADISALMGHKNIVSTWSYGRRIVRDMAKTRLRERLGNHQR